MKLYSESELIHSQEIILSTSDIITSTDSDELKRRNFMLLSAFSMAMMMYPILPQKNQTTFSKLLF